MKYIYSILIFCILYTNVNYAQDEYKNVTLKIISLKDTIPYGKDIELKLQVKSANRKNFFDFYLLEYKKTNEKQWKKSYDIVADMGLAIAPNQRARYTSSTVPYEKEIELEYFNPVLNALQFEPSESYDIRVIHYGFSNSFDLKKENVKMDSLVLTFSQLSEIDKKAYEWLKKNKMEQFTSGLYDMVGDQETISAAEFITNNFPKSTFSIPANFYLLNVKLNLDAKMSEYLNQSEKILDRLEKMKSDMTDRQLRSYRRWLRHLNNIKSKE